ncbi:MFS transporter [Actinospica durhamensis]|uniref:MFS transporter n=1 Tax=Actinospica durhamensis TaxID=1508375 RepID=A0A941EKQ6_9ACTN|nr:MFS transporter [Actinospica durhamensis]MBR7834245.1 MFS transporter [Actinospica durhamensis]
MRVLTTATIAGGEGVRGSRLWLSVVALSTLSVVSMDSLAVPIALNQAGEGLHGSIALLEWTVIAYNLGFAALVPTSCALYARHGSRRVLSAGQALLAGASVLCALAPDGAWLVAGRTVQGVAAALVVPAVLFRASRIPSPRTRGVVLPGCAGGIIELSAAAGPLVCAAVAQGEDWRWIFWLNVPPCLLALALTAVHGAEEYTGRRRTDVGSALALGIGTFALAWAVTRSAREGWADAQVLAGLAVGVVLLAYSLAGHVPMGLFRVKEFLAARIGYACACAGLYCMVLLLSWYFLAAEPQGRPLDAWLHLLPWCLGLLACAPLAETLALKVGTSLLMALGLAASALSLGLLAWDVHQGSEYSRLLFPLLLGGCGIGVALPAGQTLALVVPAKTLPNGAGVAAVGALRNIGGALGVAVVGTLPRGYASGAARSSPVELAPAIALAGAICLAGSVVYFALPSRRSPI